MKSIGVHVFWFLTNVKVVCIYNFVDAKSPAAMLLTKQKHMCVENWSLGKMFII
jgi:hypothetical protein